MNCADHKVEDGIRKFVKIATWNVNGIRARQAQVLRLDRARAARRVCLQEIKAARDQLPRRSASCAATGATGTATKGYSGVGAARAARALAPERPRFAHPPFDHETPHRRRRELAGDHGRVGLRAERRQGLRGQDALPRGAGATAPATLRATGDRSSCAATSTSRATDRDVHPKERKPNSIGQRPDERELLERILAHGLVDVGRDARSRQRRSVHLVGALAQPAPAQHRLALDYVLASAALARASTACVVQREVGTSDHAPVVATFGEPP